MAGPPPLPTTNQPNVIDRAIALACAPSSAAARATTRFTGSLVLWPNATGVARRTHDIPVRCTAADGRAWANANPGATTMYGPLVSTLSIIDPV